MMSERLGFLLVGGGASGFASNNSDSFRSSYMICKVRNDMTFRSNVSARLGSA